MIDEKQEIKIIYRALKTRHKWFMLEHYGKVLRHVNPDTLARTYNLAYEALTRSFLLWRRDRVVGHLARIEGDMQSFVQLFAAAGTGSPQELGRVWTEVRRLVRGFAEPLNLPVSLVRMAEWGSPEHLQTVVGYFLYQEVTYVTRKFWHL